ncbi:MAG: lysylphosphatidylglycerol synthase transmembrane domain-containing protein [Anaerolineales bacterium]
MTESPQIPEKRLTIGVLIRWTGTLVALGLMVWLLSRQGWDAIWADIQQIGLLLFLTAIGLLMGSRFAISLRWYALLRGAGEDISYLASLKLTFAGLFSNNFLPSTIGGDVVRLAGGIQAGWDGAVMAASLVVDRLVGMSGMATFLPLVVPSLMDYYKAEVFTPGQVLAFGAAAETSRLKKWVNKGKSILLRIWRSMLIWVRKPKTLVLPFLATFGHMLFTFSMVSVILYGLGETELSFLTVGGLWALVYFITLIPISIAGLGVQELVIVFAYHTLGGVTEPHALTLALLFRTLMMLSSLPGAVFVPDILNKRKKTGEVAK